MDSREAYKEKYEAQVKAWGAKVDALKARTEKAEPAAKIDLAPHVTGVEEKLDAAKAKLAHIGTATDEKWNDFRKDADKIWGDFERSVWSAFAMIKAQRRSKDPAAKGPTSKR